jgi:hypothetical protein
VNDGDGNAAHGSTVNDSVREEDEIGRGASDGEEDEIGRGDSDDDGDEIDDAEESDDGDTMMMDAFS